MRELRFLFVFSCVCAQSSNGSRRYNIVRAHGEATKMNKVKINVGHRRCQWHRSKTVCHRAYLCGVRLDLPTPYTWHFGVRFTVEKSFSHYIVCEPWVHQHTQSDFDGKWVGFSPDARSQTNTPEHWHGTDCKHICAGKSYCGKTKSCVAKQILVDVFVLHRAFQTANT